MKKVLNAFQKLGKSLMLPIAVLPIAGLLLRFGQSDLLNVPFLAKAGGAIFDNLPMLFAIGVAVGLAKDNHGAAGLAGAISFYILNATSQAVNVALYTGMVTDPTTAGKFLGQVADPSTIEGLATLAPINMAHFAGIIAGIIAGLCYNAFNQTKLPDWLAFFGGRRFVPIVTGGTSLVIGGVLGVIWPTIQKGLDAFAGFMQNSSGVGEFLYGFFNRLLLPFGCHHILNTQIWFTLGDYTKADGTLVTGDLNRFFAGDTTAGSFMAGFFPIMMFALPAAALAMWFCAKKENKAAVGGALFSVAFTAFLCGITEPIEFMFMFLAPVLYGIHAVLTGVSVALCSLLGIRHGFTFSAGAIDYFLNMGLAEKGWLLIPIGLAFAVVYFFLFVFFIKKFDMKTPGREDDEESEDFGRLVKDKGMSGLAAAYVEKLGGKDNIKEIEACITRLRLVLKDNSTLNEKELKALGASGVMKAGKQVTQVIVGTKAELLVDEMKKLL